MNSLKSHLRSDHLVLLMPQLSANSFLWHFPGSSGKGASLPVFSLWGGKPKHCTLSDSAAQLPSRCSLSASRTLLSINSSGLIRMLTSSSLADVGICLLHSLGVPSRGLANAVGKLLSSETRISAHYSKMMLEKRVTVFCCIIIKILPLCAFQPLAVYFGTRI